jgi:CheY-like chemotaxis protein
MSTKILISENTQSAGKSLSHALRDAGYEVVTAHDAVHTIVLAREHQPSLVVLSAQLPGGGAAALRRIRSNVYTTNIPVLAVLADTGPSEIEMTEAGAQACVNLPISQDALSAAVLKNLAVSLDFTQAPDAVLNDPGRMADLHETGLLDSPPSAEFDRLTRLASRLIGTPTSLVSLVDRDRQFFKSQVGLGQPWSGERQSKLSHSFCQWVISGGEPLLIDNANEHPVLRNNLAVRDMGVVAYAGVPLLGHSSKPIGSFCAIDSVPRKWTHQDLELLQDLGAAIEAMAVSGSAARRIAVSAENWPPSWVQLIAEGTLGAVRVLRRYGERLQAQDRKDLLDLIEHQTSLLLSPRR